MPYSSMRMFLFQKKEKAQGATGARFAEVFFHF